MCATSRRARPLRRTPGTGQRSRDRGESLVADRLPAALTAAVGAAGDPTLRRVDLGEGVTELLDQAELDLSLELLAGDVGGVLAGTGDFAEVFLLRALLELSLAVEAGRRAVGPNAFRVETVEGGRLCIHATAPDEVAGTDASRWANSISAVTGRVDAASSWPMPTSASSTVNMPTNAPSRTSGSRRMA